MALSEIEKLERRYAENPQGLTFAPLAEVHRKNGEVKRALDLLGPGLQLHPDYIPASIVLGRCHMDLGDVPAAEAAFLRVLSLDGENVIALKALGDISERLLKFDDAERWLNTLLTLDRSNDDAREQLQRVEIARRQAEVASSVEPSTVADAVPPSGESAAAVEPAVPAVAAEPTTSVAEIIPPRSPFGPPAFEPPVAEPAVGWVSHAGPVDEPNSMSLDELEPSQLRELPLEPVELGFDRPAGYEEPELYDAAIEPIDGLVGREVDTADDGADEFKVETSEDIVLNSSGGGEFQVPDASQELFASGARGRRGAFEEDTPMPSRGETATPDRSAPDSTAAGALARSEPPPAETAPPVPVGSQASESGTTPPDAVTADAAASHRSDSSPSPAPHGAGAMAAPWDTTPATPGGDRVNAAEAAPSMSEPDFRYPRRNEEGTPSASPPAPKRSYSAGETGGPSVAQLFQGILSARPPLQAPAPAVRQPQPGSSAGAPTRPAADTLSLSSVFGEEGSDTPPDVPAAGAMSGSVSFDDFFGSSPAAPSTRPSRAPDPKSDDLDQFHAWLQNLKR